MIRSPAAGRLTPIDGVDLRLAMAAPVLILLGYYAVADPRVSAALLGVAMLSAWGVVAFRKARLALVASFPMLLLAGTKFRYRDSHASLAGVLDAQVLLELLLFAFIGVGVVAAWLGTQDRRRPSAAELVIAGYAGLALLSTAWSAAPAMTLVRSTQLVVVALLAIVSMRLMTPAHVLLTAMRAIGWFVAVCAVIAATLPWTTGPLFPDEGVFRFRWFAVHPIEAATLAGIGALGFLGVASLARPGETPFRSRGRVWLTVLFLGAALLLTSSRGPLIGFTVAAGVVWLYGVRPSLRVAAVLLTCSVALTAVLYGTEVRSWIEDVADQNSPITRLFFRAQTADALFELNGRLGLWSDIGPMVADNIVVGSGYQASRAALLDVAEWAAYAHNALLQTALDLGILGVLATLALMVMGLRAGVDARVGLWVRATVAALTVFLVLNSLSNESFAAAPDVELLILFACALTGSSVRRHALQP